MLKPILYLWLMASAWRLGATERIFDFKELKENESPAGFRSTVAGSGQPGEWKIVLESAPPLSGTALPASATAGKRPVLAQVSRDRTDEHSPMLIWEEETLGDFTISTRFKIVEGETEQMAGLAFRFQDERNYYYIRASALGNTFNFFKIVNGIRSAPIGARVEIARGMWHEMVVECKGSQIRSWLDGKEVFPALGDKSFNEGKIGFWTKSDSVSYFADTKVTYNPKIILAQILVRESLEKYPRLLRLKIFAAVNRTAPKIVASTDPKELGSPAQKEEQDVIEHSTVYHGKDNGRVLVTMPLHDANGDTVAAVKVIMKSFPGQTEKNAIARALPIVKQMEVRVHSLSDLTK